MTARAAPFVAPQANLAVSPSRKEAEQAKHRSAVLRNRAQCSVLLRSCHCRRRSYIQVFAGAGCRSRPHCPLRAPVKPAR